MTYQCPRCHGKGTTGFNGLGEPMACAMCNGRGTIPQHKALTWAARHPGSPLWRQLLPYLAATYHTRRNG